VVDLHTAVICGVASVGIDEVNGSCCTRFAESHKRIGEFEMLVLLGNTTSRVPQQPQILDIPSVVKALNPSGFVIVGIPNPMQLEL
jgi:hypothetical protein